MTDNQKKVLDCLVDKKLRDKASYGSYENRGWMTIRDIAYYCGFEKNATAVGCLVRLMKDEIVESTEETTIDGMIHKYYRIVPSIDIKISYELKPKSSWEGDFAAISGLNK